jgi:hypothetical protein
VLNPEILLESFDFRARVARAEHQGGIVASKALECPCRFGARLHVSMVQDAVDVGKHHDGKALPHRLNRDDILPEGAATSGRDPILRGETMETQVKIRFQESATIRCSL